MPPLSRRQFATVTAAGLVGLAHARTQAFHRALEQTGLKEVFKDDFLIGTAVDGRTVDDPSTPLAQLVAREFNAITPTNMMKWGRSSRARASRSGRARTGSSPSAPPTA